MVVGIDSYHDSSKKGRSVGGVIASMNTALTRYYSRCTFQHNMQELLDGLKVCMKGLPVSINFGICMVGLQNKATRGGEEVEASLSSVILQFIHTYFPFVTLHNQGHIVQILLILRLGYFQLCLQLQDASFDQ